MPRSRSGSFYCPLEPALPPLSIAQKAAISTAPAPSSSPCLSSRQSSSSSSLRRHVRTPSFDGADGPASVTLPAAKLETTTIGTTEPLSLRNKSSIVNPKRYPWSPAKPSPLRRQTNAASPMCASALWSTHQDLLPLYQPSISLQSHKSRARTQSSMRQSVIRHAFMSSPMGEKTQLYGLRVAWCVFGDVKEQLAKDIFVHGTQAGYHPPAPATTSVVEEDAHVTEHVEVVSQSDALSPPPLRSRLRRERSFIWDVQGPLVTPDQLPAVSAATAATADEHLNAAVELSDSDTESEYSEEDEEDTSDTETESAESEDDDDLDLELDDIELSLDDEEEVQRDILALLHSHSTTGLSNPNPGLGGKVLDGEAHWDMMSFEL